MISIIIPFYNTEKYLEECLSSIKTQTFSDYECIMIDDGSIDSSREIAKKFLDDSRFKLLGDKHIGFPLSKNLGLDNAKGEYIVFLDSDDYLELNCLEILYNNLIETDSDISVAQHTRKMEHHITDKPIKTNVYEGKESILSQLLTNTFLWNKLYKRYIFDNMRFEDVEALSDTMLNYKLFERANKTCYTNIITYHHRVHDENMTYRVRNFSPTYWEHRLNVYITMCSYLLKYEELKRQVKNRFKRELLFIKPHLDAEIYTRYLKKPEVKLLLE